MNPIFRSSFFALLESYAPTLLAGPEARVPQARTQKLAAGQVGVFGVLGQSDWFSDTDYADVRASVRRALADPSVRTIDLVVDSPGGSVARLARDGGRNPRGQPDQARAGHRDRHCGVCRVLGSVKISTHFG